MLLLASQEEEQRSSNESQSHHATDRAARNCANIGLVATTATATLVVRSAASNVRVCRCCGVGGLGSARFATEARKDFAGAADIACAAGAAAVGLALRLGLAQFEWAERAACLAFECDLGVEGNCVAAT